MPQLPLASDACTFHAHYQEKLFLFEKYAQYALVRRTQQPPRARAPAVKLCCPKYSPIK